MKWPEKFAFDECCQLSWKRPNLKSGFNKNRHNYRVCALWIFELIADEKRLDRERFTKTQWDTVLLLMKEERWFMKEHAGYKDFGNDAIGKKRT